MAGFGGGRKGSNISHYLSNLNAIPSEHDLATQQPENFDFGTDLANFTNTEFFDFDQGENVFRSSVDYNHPHHPLNAATSSPAQENVKSGAFDFHFQPLDPFLNAEAPLGDPQAPLPNDYSISQRKVTSPTSFDASPAPGSKRSASAASPGSNISQEESSRLAAEEDKRRRNTAASARFRVKKKQREQALEKAAKELNDKTAHLEQKIGQLQTQNEWLKNLITEKKGKDFLAEEWKAFKRRAGSDTDSSEDAERSPEQKKKGVGTL
ncbi:MAG: hypothetical protein L6R41_006354 [Letrouitia leprolyta]|nr:MAG: hypothetical protein L6R41_006354 [Letrouitia leprolyta]